MAEPIISDLALRGVGSCPYEPEAKRTRFSILNKIVEMSLRESDGLLRKLEAEVNH